MAENRKNKAYLLKLLAGNPVSADDNVKPPSKNPNLDGAQGAKGNEEASAKTKEDAEVMNGNLSDEIVEKIAN